MPTASSSLSAFMHTPPTSGSLRGHLLEDLGERRHRVAGEEPAARRDHRLGDGLAPLQQPAPRSGRHRCGRRRSLTAPPHARRSAPAARAAAPSACRTCRPGTRSRGRSASRPCTRCTRRRSSGYRYPRALTSWVGHDQDAGRAGVDAQVAALARLDVDHQGAAGEHGGVPPSDRSPWSSTHSGGAATAPATPRTSRPARSGRRPPGPARWLDVLAPVGRHASGDGPAQRVERHQAARPRRGRPA